MQALVHEGILRGVRGPHGGYSLGRSKAQITANEILRAAGRAEETADEPLPGTFLVDDVVLPALAQAEHAFAAALGTIQLQELVKRAETSSS